MDNCNNNLQSSLPPYKDEWKETIKHLMLSGKCKRFNDITIKDSKYEFYDKYTKVILTVRANLPVFVYDNNGNYQEETSNIIYTSAYAIAQTFKEDDNLSWMGDSILQHAHIIPLLLNGSRIDVIVQKVVKDEEYKNPFGVEKIRYDRDILIKYIVQVKLGKTGEKMAAKLAEKLLGF